MDPRQQRQLHVSDYSYVGEVSQDATLENKYKALVTDMTERQKNLRGMQTAMDEYETECHEARSKQWEAITDHLIEQGKMEKGCKASVIINPKGQIFLAVVEKAPVKEAEEGPTGSPAETESEA